MQVRSPTSLRQAKINMQIWRWVQARREPDSERRLLLLTDQVLSCILHRLQSLLSS